MESKFSFNIKIIDDSGIWDNIWYNLKDHLNIHFVPIVYKDLKNLKCLNSFNIKLSEQIEKGFFTFYVFKLNSVSELKGQFKENILKNLSNKDYFPILIMNIDNTDTSLKSSLKVFEKIKSELKNKSIKLLSVNTNNLKLTELVNEFFKEFKNRISIEINKSLIYNYNIIESLKFNKNDNKEISFNYLNTKDNLFDLLHLAEFSQEVIKLCEFDIFIEFKNLDHIKPNNINNSYFIETFSFIDFNEQFIKSKIQNKTLTNLDYQIYLFYLIVKNYKNLGDFKKLYSFMNKFLYNINNLKSFFPNIYYFNFWCINLIGKIIPLYKTMKSNYFTPHEEETNIKAQIEIFYILKKFLKNFARLLNFEIPNAKIFRLLANDKNLNTNENSEEDLEISYETRLEKSVSNYLNNSNAINPNIKNTDEEFQIFMKDVNNNLDKKNKTLILNREKLLEEYLTVISSIEKTHRDLKENRLIFKIEMEKLPILFSLGKFNLMKNILIEKIKNNRIYKRKSIQNEETYMNFEKDLPEDLDKWPLLKEYVCSLLILLLNSLDKLTENIRIIIDILNVYKSNDIISNYFDLNDKNLIKNILKKYLDDNIKINYNRNSNSNYSNSVVSQSELNTNNYLQINLNDIIKLECLINNENNRDNYNLDSNKKRKINFINQETTKNIIFNFFIQNKTDLEMKISSITIEFKDEINNKILKYDHSTFLINNSENKELETYENYNSILIKCSEKSQFKIEMDLKNFDSLKSNKISSLVIERIFCYLTWGVLGIYKYDKFESIIYIKNNDFEVNTTVKNFNSSKYENNNSLNFSENENDKNNLKTIYFNVENPLFINFSKLKNFDFNKYFFDIEIKLIDVDNINEQEENDDKIKTLETELKFPKEEENIKLDLNNQINFITFYEKNIEKFNDLEFIISSSYNNHENSEDYKNGVQEKIVNRNNNIKIYKNRFKDNIKKYLSENKDNNLEIKIKTNNEKKISVNKLNYLKEDNLNENFILNLNLLVSNSDFSRKFKQILKIEINILDCETFEKVFFSKEEFYFDFIHLFSYNSKSTLRFVENQNSPLPLQQKIISECNDVKNFIDRIDNLENSFHSENNFLNDYTILVQNSVSLNQDFEEVFIEINNNYFKINLEQKYSLIYQIPLNYEKVVKHDKNLFFNFKFGRENQMENSEINPVNLDNYNLNINENIISLINLKSFKFIFPFDFMIENLNNIKNMEYIVIIKLNSEKTKTKIEDINSVVKNIVNNEENFSQSNISSEINKKENLNIDIKQDTKINEKNDYRNLEIFKEIDLKINIRKIKNNSSLFLIKINDHSNWTIEGINEMKEKFEKGFVEKNIFVKLTPLQDGIIKLPKFEFFEINDFHSHEVDNERNESFTDKEYQELNKNSIFIQGNEKILKINSVYRTENSN